jgi:hypothetical protein
LDFFTSHGEDLVYGGVVGKVAVMRGKAMKSHASETS